MRIILLLAATAAAVIHASNDDFTKKFCRADGKRCPDSDIIVVSAKSLHQCKNKCARYADDDNVCQSAFWHPEVGKCHLKSRRCTLDELDDNAGEGVDLYRRKKGEKCPKGRPKYKRQRIQYLNTLCGREGVICKGVPNLKKARVDTLDACISRCVKVKACAGVDYNLKNKKCKLKAKSCTTNNLKQKSNNVNYMRLVAGQSKCPENTLKYDDEPPPQGRCLAEGDIISLPVDGHSAEGSEGINGEIHPSTYTCRTTQPTPTQNAWWTIEFYSPAVVHSFDLFVHRTGKVNSPVSFTVLVDDQICLSRSYQFRLDANAPLERFQCVKPLCGQRVTIILADREPLLVCYFLALGQTQQACPANSVPKAQNCVCGNRYSYYKKECQLACEFRENVCPCNPGFVLVGDKCERKCKNGCLPKKADPDLDMDSDATILPVDAETAALSGGEPDAKLVIDGDRSTCSQTVPKLGQSSWFGVKLQRGGLVRAVDIRFQGVQNISFYIYVDGLTCIGFNGKVDQFTRFDCNSDLCGSAVVVWLDPGQPLSICEIVVRGQTSDFYAPKTSCGPYATGNQFLPVSPTTAAQSVTLNPDFGPEGAIDGASESCAIANPSDNQNAWWSVELAQRGTVSGIMMYLSPANEGEDAVNFSVFVDSELCLSSRVTFGYRTYEIKTLFCRKPICGKKITIIGENDQLYACEIRPFGKLPPVSLE